MVVRKDDAGAVMLRRIDDDCLQREVHPRLVAFVAADVEAARLIVDMRDPQALPRDVKLGEAAGEELPGCGKSIELQWEFGTLVPHGLALAERGAWFDLNRVSSRGEIICFGPINFFRALSPFPSYMRALNGRARRRGDGCCSRASSPFCTRDAKSGR